MQKKVLDVLKRRCVGIWKEWNLDLLGEHSIIRVAVTRYGEGVAALKRPRLAADLASLCIVLKL